MIYLCYQLKGQSEVCLHFTCWGQVSLYCFMHMNELCGGEMFRKAKGTDDIVVRLPVMWDWGEKYYYKRGVLGADWTTVMVVNADKNLYKKFIGFWEYDKLTPDDIKLFTEDRKFCLLSAQIMEDYENGLLQKDEGGDQ